MGLWGKGVRLHRTESALRRAANRRTRRLRISPEHNAPAPGHQVHQPLELQLDGREVRVDIGVGEFQRSDDQVVRMIMKKLRSSAEQSGFVFVAFQDERLSSSQTRALA